MLKMSLIDVLLFLSLAPTLLVRAIIFQNETTPQTRYELFEGDLYKVESLFEGETYHPSKPMPPSRVSPSIDGLSRQKEVWDFISTFDSYKTSVGYEIVDGKPTLTNFRYIIVPIWWSDFDITDPEYQMDPDTVLASFVTNKEYYIDMSWGKMPNGVTYEALEQQEFDISSESPSWGETEDSAYRIVGEKGYVQDVDYNGICIMYYVSKSGPFAGAGKETNPLI